jgi:hypothetical protein
MEETFPRNVGITFTRLHGVTSQMTELFALFLVFKETTSLFNLCPNMVRQTDIPASLFKYWAPCLHIIGRTFVRILFTNRVISATLKKLESSNFQQFNYPEMLLASRRLSPPRQQQPGTVPFRAVGSAPTNLVRFKEFSKFVTFFRTLYCFVRLGIFFFPLNNQF